MVIIFLGIYYNIKADLIILIKRVGNRYIFIKKSYKAPNLYRRKERGRY